MIKRFLGADEKGRLRKFALQCCLFLLVSGFLFHRGYWSPSDYLQWAGLCLVALLSFLVFPAPLHPLRRVLRILSRWLGLAVTAIILALVYFLVLTPLALAARIIGKRFLALGRDPGLRTYWVKRDPGMESYPEKQY